MFQVLYALEKGKIMKHQDIIEKMTIEEKAAFLSGKGEWQTRDFERLGIPSIFCSDGPHGIRKQAGAGDHLGLNASLPATCFPTAATIANSWDPELGKTLGETLGEEAMAQGVNVLLGSGRKRRERHLRLDLRGHLVPLFLENLELMSRGLERDFSRKVVFVQLVGESG